MLAQDEAEAALWLDETEQTLAAFARRAELTESEAAVRLKRLADAGVAFTVLRDGTEYFQLAPFCTGTLDFLVGAGLDATLSRYIQEYVDEANALIRREEEGAVRTVSINREIQVDRYRMPLEEAMAYIDGNTIIYDTIEMLYQQGGQGDAPERPERPVGFAGGRHLCAAFLLSKACCPPENQSVKPRGLGQRPKSNNSASERVRPKYKYRFDKIDRIHSGKDTPDLKRTVPGCSNRSNLQWLILLA